MGAVPAVTIAAAFRMRRGGMTKAEVAGSLQRGPVQLVQAELSDLLVPAASEMVLEGVILPEETAETGPFPGTFGYATGERKTGVVFKVQSITHRKDPILPFCTWGTPTCDIHIARGLDCDTQLLAAFEKQGSPVANIFTPPWLSGSVVACTTQVPYTAYAQAVAGVVRNTEPTKYTPYILVCNDDIDITNPVALFHAMVTKCHPDRDTWIIQHTEAAEDAPYLTAEERAQGRGAAAIFDCTWPLDWDRSIAVPPKVDFESCYPLEMREKVLAQWSSELGFPKETDRPV
jgi:4-hydroxy-3-polyprenylbenzoate decarboxylase